MIWIKTNPYRRSMVATTSLAFGIHKKQGFPKCESQWLRVSWYINRVPWDDTSVPSYLFPGHHHLWAQKILQDPWWCCPNHARCGCHHFGPHKVSQFWCCHLESCWARYTQRGSSILFIFIFSISIPPFCPKEPKVAYKCIKQICNHVLFNQEKCMINDEKSSQLSLFWNTVFSITNTENSNTINTVIFNRKKLIKRQLTCF